MKKILLKAGIVTIGSLSLFLDKFEIEAKTPELIEVIENSELDLHGEQLVRKYAKIYEINEEVVVKKINEMTGNFWSHNWLLHYQINDINYENEEIAILTTVRDIYKNPEKYNLSYEELETNKEYNANECCENLISYYSELLGVNKEVAMSIVYAECGCNLDSTNYLENNNPAGMGPYNYYNNIEHGVIEFIFLLKNGYGCTLETDESFFYTMGPTYCTVGYENWINNTLGYYNNLMNDYYHYTYDREYQKVKY